MSHSFECIFNQYYKANVVTLVHSGTLDCSLLNLLRSYETNAHSRQIFLMDVKRNAVIALHLAGASQTKILRELRHLAINRKFVYRTIKRYNESGSVNKRYGGGPKRTATSREMVRRVKAKIDRNPRRSGRKMAAELKISQTSMRKILKNELKVKPLKIQKAHGLTPEQMKVRVERSKSLKRLHESGLLPNIVFSDEKIFTIEQFVNKQNDRVYLKERSNENMALRLATRNQKPEHVMVWAAVTADGRSPLAFVEAGIKVNASKYIDTILEPVLKPWLRKHFKERPYTFQQDSAPSHKANITQDWLKNNVSGFISREQWTSNSPDLNPLDYSIWGELQTMVGVKKYQSVDSLKLAIRREWKRIPQAHIRAACESFVGRLTDVIRAKGQQIEQMN